MNEGLGDVGWLVSIFWDDVKTELKGWLELRKVELIESVESRVNLGYN